MQQADQRQPSVRACNRRSRSQHAPPAPRSVRGSDRLRDRRPSANQHHYLEGVKALWIEQRNPYWIWVAIQTSIRNDEPFPDWVCEYLEQVADQLLATPAASSDCSRKSRQFLAFNPKSGPKHSLASRLPIHRKEPPTGPSANCRTQHTSAYA